MVTIYAPVRATIGTRANNGKMTTKTVMLTDGFKADVDNIADAVKVTASIVGGFSKGYHPGDVREDENGDLHISAVKSE